MKDPKRLIEPDSDAPELLRGLLGVAKADLPSDAALAALRARLPPPVPPTPPPFPTGWVVGVVLTVLVGGGGYAVWPRAGEPVAPIVEAPAVEVVPEVVEAPVGVEAPGVGTVDSLPPARVVVPKVAAVPERAPAPRADVPRVPEAEATSRAPVPQEIVKADDLDRELLLVEKAQGALRADPAGALATAAVHLREFPSGQLAQEREVVAIEALVALGRGEEATARAAAFRAKWPTSAHLRRIDTLVGGGH